MIRVKNGSVELKGNAPDILSELSLAIKHIKIVFMESGISREAVDNMVSDAVRVADMTPKQMIDEIIQRMSEVAEIFE